MNKYGMFVQLADLTEKFGFNIGEPGERVLVQRSLTGKSFDGLDNSIIRALFHMGGAINRATKGTSASPPSRGALPRSGVIRGTIGGGGHGVIRGTISRGGHGASGY